MLKFAKFLPAHVIFFDKWITCLSSIDSFKVYYELRIVQIGRPSFNVPEYLVIHIDDQGLWENNSSESENCYKSNRKWKTTLQLKYRHQKSIAYTNKESIPP